MSIQPGDEVSYRLMPEIDRFEAIVVSIDDHRLALELRADRPAALAIGRYLLITEGDADTEHYAEVAENNGGTVTLRRVWTGKRGFFRVDDVFPVKDRIIAETAVRRPSRIFSGYAETPEEFDVRDESVSPRLWKMLLDIDAKLAMILERLDLEREGLSDVESIPVNISASGIRIVFPAEPKIGELHELKMLLPVFPPVGVLVHGSVVRVERRDDGTYETSLRFVDLIDEVRDVIIQYTLKRQREIIQQQRDSGESWTGQAS